MRYDSTLKGFQRQNLTKFACFTILQLSPANPGNPAQGQHQGNLPSQLSRERSRGTSCITTKNEFEYVQSSNTQYKKKNTVKDKREWTTGRGKLVLMSDSGSSQEK